MVVTSEDVELTLDTQNNVYAFTMPEKEVTLTISEWQKLSPELAWSADNATVTIGADDNVYPTLSNTHNVTVEYTSSNGSAATIVSNTGVITLVGRGTTTISAVFAGNDTYEAQTVSYTLTVRQVLPSTIELQYGQADNDRLIQTLGTQLTYAEYTANSLTPLTNETVKTLAQNISAVITNSRNITVTLNNTFVGSIHKDNDNYVVMDAETGENIILTLSQETAGESDIVWTLTPNSEYINEGDVFKFYLSDMESFEYSDGNAYYTDGATGWDILEGTDDYANPMIMATISDPGITTSWTVDNFVIDTTSYNNVSLTAADGTFNVVNQNNEVLAIINDTAEQGESDHSYELELPKPVNVEYGSYYHYVGITISPE